MFGRAPQVYGVSASGAPPFINASMWSATLTEIDEMPPSKYWERLENFAWIVGAARRGSEAPGCSGS